MCELLHVFRRMREVSPDVTSSPAAARLDRGGKQMKVCHDEHAPGRHIYVLLFGTAVGQQGRGYGRRLMEFITTSADHIGGPCYLETSGAKNERFYGHNGYEVKGHYSVEHDGKTYDPEGLGGFTGMVRPAGPQLLK